MISSWSPSSFFFSSFFFSHRNYYKITWTRSDDSHEVWRVLSVTLDNHTCHKCTVNINVKQGKRMERKKSKIQFTASPLLSPNQRTENSPLNSGNYLKDNQWLFTCQSWRKHNTYKRITTSVHTKTHMHTPTHKSHDWTLLPACVSVSDMQTALSSYIKTCHLEEQKKIQQKILTSIPLPVPQMLTPAFCSR